jgi:hypothetical protein
MNGYLEAKKSSFWVTNLRNRRLSHGIGALNLNLFADSLLGPE